METRGTKYNRRVFYAQIDATRAKFDFITPAYYRVIDSGGNLFRDVRRPRLRWMCSRYFRKQCSNSRIVSITNGKGGRGPLVDRLVSRGARAYSPLITTSRRSYDDIIIHGDVMKYERKRTESPRYFVISFC